MIVWILIAIPIVIIFFFIGRIAGYNQGFDDCREINRKHREGMKKAYEKQIDLAEKVAFKRGVIVGKNSFLNKKAIDEIKRYKYH